MNLSQLRNNPILAHYSPFSRSRRFRSVIALILYAAAVAAFNIAFIIGPGRYNDDSLLFTLFLETASLAVLPSLIFLAFAPKYRSREFLEELTLTQMSRREIVIGYCLPPLLMIALVVAINLVFFVFFSLLKLATSSPNVPVGGYLVVAIYHVIGAVIAASAITRNWTTYPNSIFRPLVQVPIICAAHAVVITVATLSVAISANLMLLTSRYDDEVVTLLSLLVSAALTLFPLLRAVRFAPARFFRSIDAPAYQRAYWAANELTPSRKSPAASLAFSLLVRQVLRDNRTILRALAIVLLLVLAYAIYAYKHPMDFMQGYVPVPGSIVEVDRQLAIMIALTDPYATVAIPILLLLIHLYLRTRSHPQRALTIMAGGIIPSVISSLLPALILFLVWIGIRIGVMALYLHHLLSLGDVVGEWILLIIAFPLLSLFLTMIFLPRPRRPVLRIIFLPLGLPILTYVFRYLISLPAELHLSPGPVTFIAISVVILAGIAFFAFLFRKSQWKPRYVIAASVAYGIIPILFSLTPLPGNRSEYIRLFHGGEFVGFVAISASFWFVAYGFDILAQRIHRLELAYLRPLTTNIDAIPRDESDS